MSGNEYKAIRERLGMTQAIFAQAVGRSRKIINEREQAAEVPLEAALAAEFLALRSLKRSSSPTAMSAPTMPDFTQDAARAHGSSVQRMVRAHGRIEDKP